VDVDVGAFLSGIHTRSNRLIEATRRFEKGELSEIQLQKYWAEDTRALVNLQIKSNLTIVSDGMLCWPDPLRPLIRNMEGIILGGYSRWFETNTFYRKPIVLGELSLKNTSLRKSYRLQAIPSSYDKMIILPGPYTLAQLSESRYYRDFWELMSAYAKVLSGFVQELLHNKTLTFMFQEPCLVSERFKPDKECFSQIGEVLGKIIHDESRTIIHTFFGDISKVRNLMLEFDNVQLGVDLTETSPNALSYFEGCKLALGIVDSLSPIEETPKLLKKSLEIIGRSKFNKIAICPNTDLRYLPRKIADRKLRALEFLKEETEAKTEC
jgi:5-methyltetrahydropteroyltriglutamate--homocysteine methyltransferase